jgi:hypothetical protein
MIQPFPIEHQFGLFDRFEGLADWGSLFDGLGMSSELLACLIMMLVLGDPLLEGKMWLMHV